MKRFVLGLAILIPAGALAQTAVEFNKFPSSIFSSIRTQKAMTGINQVPAPDLSLSTRFGASGPDYKNPNVVAWSPGNMISFCPSQSCVTDPTNDHQRTSLLVSNTTQDDAHSQEQGLAVMTTIDKGFTIPWATSKAFKAGDNIRFGAQNTTYRQTVANCTSAASGSFPATNKGTNIVDGTCRWDWINDAAIVAKVGYYNETKVMAGGGSSWAQAINNEIAPGATPSFNINTEFDFFNNSGIDCVSGVADCHGLYISIGGNAKVTDGISLFSSNTANWAARWGMRIAGDKFAEETMLALDGNSQRAIGIGSSGIGGNTFSVATIQDTSTSPVSLEIKGSHTNGIALSGAFSGAQIAGNNFTLFPDGGLQAANLNARPDATHQLAVGYNVGIDRSEIQSTHLGAFNTELALNPVGGVVSVGPGYLKEVSLTPASSASACITGTRTWDVNYEYRCVATNTWKRSALSSW